MRINLTKYTFDLLLDLKIHMQTDDDSDVVEEAIQFLHQHYVDLGKIEIAQEPKSLITALEGILKKKYRCLINNPDLEQNEYFIYADSEDDAWEQMARRFSNETNNGFTIELYDDGEFGLQF